MSFYGMDLTVSQPEKAAQWLCDKLFFTLETAGESPVVVNGNVRLRLVRGRVPERREDMALGWRHIAMETHDIDAALAYCRTLNVPLEVSETGGPRHSAQVYGTGMFYINIFTEFGFTVEVAQKLHKQSPAGKELIWGLEHVGLQVHDIEATLKFYEGLGFRRDFAPVTNHADGHTIHCCMVSREDTVIEVYEFHDLPELTRDEAPAYGALLVRDGERTGELQGPDGEGILFAAP